MDIIGLSQAFHEIRKLLPPTITCPPVGVSGRISVVYQRPLATSNSKLPPAGGRSTPSPGSTFHPTQAAKAADQRPPELAMGRVLSARLPQAAPVSGTEIPPETYLASRRAPRTGRR